MKIDKSGEDLVNKKSQIRTCRREKHLKKNKMSSCFIQNSRVGKFRRFHVSSKDFDRKYHFSEPT